jgi:glycosidase
MKNKKSSSERSDYVSIVYQKRLDRNIKKLRNSYFNTYQKLGAKQCDFESLLSMMKNRFEERSEALRKLDKRKKTWYMSRNMIGYMVYIDLFSNTFKKLPSRIPYLKELGISYVHLMPLLKAREGENDGGYAVEDYLDVASELGTLEDFELVLEQFRHANIDVCIDYVVNHTADTHEWAKKALQGDPFYQDMFIMYDDRTIPDQFDRHVPEVLPDRFPGNFTYKKEIKKWVFTSFSDFQWDLNFKNPYVFEQMLSTMLKLANKGINIIRLDAIPFMWKEVGTSCRNLDEIHDLLYMFQLVKDVVCPSLALLGEAIVEPHEIFKYFGTEKKKECGLLYNANFMVNIWNAFATRDVRLLNVDNARFTPNSKSCWMNYIRCHDDIGWGFNEDAIKSFGMEPFYHKQFLINFYNGNFYGSFARGENYQYNSHSKDARTNGTSASLLGLEKAIEERFEYEKELSVKRILLAHSMTFSHRGIPLIYSGDEIATLNDHSYLSDLDKKSDGRWVHRPIFDWDRAEKRHIKDTFEYQIFEGLKKMIDFRKKSQLFDGSVTVNVIVNSDISVYSFMKAAKSEKMIFINNFSEHIKTISSSPYKAAGVLGKMEDLFTGRIIDCSFDDIRIAPYEVLWLKVIE